jgi:Leucine-rich repeat (LRR) protein
MRNEKTGKQNSKRRKGRIEMNTITNKRSIRLLCAALTAALVFTAWAVMPLARDALGNAAQDDAAWAYYTEGDWTYAIEYLADPDRPDLYPAGAYIKRYDGSSVNVVVPAQLGGYDVVQAKIAGTSVKSVDASAATELRWLTVSFQKSLASVNVSNNSKLRVIWAADCALTSLNVSHNPNLTGLEVNGNKLTALDVSANPALYSLVCYSNQLTALDLSANPALHTLWCDSNKLTSASLKLGACANLVTFEANDNLLTTLDLSKSPKLTSIYAADNQLTSLDTSAHAEVGYIGVANNKLTALNLSKNPKLKKLDVSGNKLTALSLAKNPELAKLYATGNQLASLDVSANAKLKELKVSGNKLTSLNTGSNVVLSELDASGNQLKALNVAKNTGLTVLDVSGNKLTALDVNANSALTKLDCSGNQIKRLAFTSQSQYHLDDVDCSDNKLTSLTFPKPVPFSLVWHYDSYGKPSYVTADHSFKNIDCSNNLLKSLDLSGFNVVDKDTGKQLIEGPASLVCKNNYITEFKPWSESWLVSKYGKSNILPQKKSGSGAATSTDFADAGAKLTVTSPTWTGKTISKFTVYSGTEKLKQGTDYKIEVISGSTKKIGVVKIRITGIGKYSGSKIVTIKILPKKPTKLKLKAGTKSIKVTWKKVSKAQQVTGYIVQYKLKTAKTWKSKTVKVSYKGKTTASYTIKKLKKGKTYQVRVVTYKKIKGGASKGTYKSLPTAVKSKKVTK